MSAAIPKLIVGKAIDRPDYELALSEEYQSLLQATAGKSEQEATEAIVAKAAYNAEAHDDTMNGLLYGILVCQPHISEMLYKVALAATKDRFGFFLTQLRRVISDKWTKMPLEVHERALWFLNSIIRDSASCDTSAIDAVLTGLMRQISVGNVSQGNVWLCGAVIELFHTHLLWLKERNTLVPFVVYTFLTVINDHARGDLLQLRDREAQLCATLIREKFDAVKVIGRDLVRLLHSASSLPDLEHAFRTVLGAPASDGNLLAGERPNVGVAEHPVSNLRLLLSMKTPRHFLESRLTPEMDSWLMWLMNNVKMGNQARYQRWFTSRFLASPESETLIPELIRFILGVFHPSNSLIASEVIPRWAVVGWLLYLPRSSHVVANARLALFYDFLFFNAKDSIMNIEPAILVITKSVPKYVDMANSLLEFLFAVCDSYIAGSPSSSVSGILVREDARHGLENAFNAIISRGVCHQQQFRETLLTNNLIDAKNRDLILQFAGQSFPELLPKSLPTAIRPAHDNAAFENLKPSRQPLDTKPEDSIKSSINPPKPAKPARPLQAQPSGLPIGSTADEEDDVLMNWASAIKSTGMASSVEITASEENLAGPTLAPTSDSPREKPRTSVAADIAVDVTMVKSITEEVSVAASKANAQSFSNAILKLLSSGLFLAHPSSLEASILDLREQTAKAIVECLSDELVGYDPKQWIFSPEGIPANKVPSVPLLFLIFNFFHHGEDAVSTSVAWLVEALRSADASIGWRLLCFCVQRANLVTVTLYNKTTKEAGDILNNPLLMEKEREWFNAQLKKLQRLDAEDEKPNSEAMFAPYEALVELVVPEEADRPSVLIRDARFCAEANVSIFLELAPSLLRFLSYWAAEEPEFVKLLCDCATPAQLTSICQRVSVGEVPMIGGCLHRVVRYSLDWPSVSQYSLWQLINAEFYDQLDTLEKVLPKILDDIDPSAHPEAVCGIQRFIQEMKPSKEVMEVLLKLSARFGPLVVVSIICWNSKTVTKGNDGSLIPKDARDAIREYDCPANLQNSICQVLRMMQSNKKNTRVFHAQACLRHLTIVYLTMNKQVSKDFFTALMKADILKLIKQFSLEKEFSDLVSFCESNFGSLPSSKKPRGKKTGQTKKSSTPEDADSNSSESGKIEARKRKRPADDADAAGAAKRRKKAEDDSDTSSIDELDVESGEILSIPRNGKPGRKGKADPHVSESPKSKQKSAKSAKATTDSYGSDSEDDSRVKQAVVGRSTKRAQTAKTPAATIKL